MNMIEQLPSNAPQICIIDNAIVQCEGSWTIPRLATLDHTLQTAHWPVVPELIWDMRKISAMDTGGAVLLYRTVNELRNEGRQVLVQGLCADFDELLQMVSANWGRTSGYETPKAGLLNTLHQGVSQKARQAVKAAEFLGECTVEIFRAIKNPSIIRWRAIIHSLELDGLLALPITGLLAFLMGVVIAYQGAEQLRRFGANIFVVDLVGISFLREIGPLIVAILIAGRSGSAYAAQ